MQPLHLAHCQRIPLRVAQQLGPQGLPGLLGEETVLVHLVEMAGRRSIGQQPAAAQLVLRLHRVAHDDVEQLHEWLHGRALDQQGEEHDAERHDPDLFAGRAQFGRQAERQGQGNRPAQPTPVHHMQPAGGNRIAKAVVEPAETVGHDAARDQHRHDRPGDRTARARAGSGRRSPGR